MISPKNSGNLQQIINGPKDTNLSTNTNNKAGSLNNHDMDVKIQEPPVS